LNQRSWFDQISTNREITQKPTKPLLIADNKQCNCQPGVVTYVTWDNSTCLYGTDTIYSGVVRYDYYGAAVDSLCLPPNPQYLKYHSGYQGAEYEISSGSPIDQAHNRNVPCAGLCQAYGHTMIPSSYECPPEWNTKYYWYLMAGYHAHKVTTQFTCMDKSLE